MSYLISILGFEWLAPFNSLDFVVDPSKSTPLSLPVPFSKEAEIFESRSCDGCIPSMVASEPKSKPRASKLELHQTSRLF